MKKNLVVVQAAVTIRNNSTSRVQALGSIYAVTGSVVSPKKQTTPPSVERVGKPFEATPLMRFSRFSRTTGITLLQTGKVVKDGWFFEPGEEITDTFVVHVRRRDFDTLRLTAEIWAGNGTVLTIEEFPSFGPEIVEDPGSGTRSVKLEWRLSETSEVHKLTRGNRIVVAAWTVGREEAFAEPYLSVYIDTEGTDAREYERNRELRTLYALVRTSSFYEMPMWRVQA